MGVCASKGPSAEEIAQEKRTKAFSEAIKEKRAYEAQVNKLLLLGAGESGKSTLFKQLIMIYGTDGKDEQEQKRYKKVVCHNVVVNAQTLAEASATHGSPVTEDGKEALTFIEEELEEDTPIDFDVAAQLTNFWTDPGIQKCYENRANYQLNDSTKYFFDRLDQIATPGWLPSPQDIVRTRVRTTGIVEHNFSIGGNEFKMFDVGGQRNERKKWIHCFESVTAVMFVAAISEFDQVLFEDYNTNRMTEAFTLFADICNSRWFQRTAFILFLNKNDLFTEKIKYRDITASACAELREFDGDCRSHEQTTAHIRAKFLEKKRNNGDPDEEPTQIHCHLTTATDTDLVHRIFDTVKQIIVDHALREAGLN
jgi:GTPase SAR1 family protein